MDSITIAIQGRVASILPVEHFGSKNTPKQVLWIDTEAKYGNQLAVEFSGDRVDLLSGLRIGERVTAHADVQGREYNGKRYVGLRGWKIDRAAKEQPAKQDDDLIDMTGGTETPPF